MNAPQYWKRHNERSKMLELLYDAFSVVETSANTPRFSYPYNMINFVPLLGIRILIANICTRWRRFFKELPHDGGLTDFFENLCASLFNDKLLNEPTVSKIHLAGQHL
jgi:hypothetical protein